MSNTENMDSIYSTLNSVLDQRPRRRTLVVLENFNAFTRTDRDGYETCTGLNGSGIRRHNGFRNLDFAKGRG